MIKKLYLPVIALLFAVAGRAQSIDTAQSQFAKIDDVKIHYKVYGKGDPLFLLHGSMESMEDWSKQIWEYAKKFKVIAVDNRGHGMSTFTDRKLDYRIMSEDIVVLMRQLKIDSAHIVGFGDGGIIGLYLAINHPKLVRKLVAIGANFKCDSTAIYPEIINKVKNWDDDKMYQFVRNHFKGYQNFNQIGQFTQRMKTMLLTEPNLTTDDLHKITCPSLFIAGDHDIIKLQHTALMYESVENGTLAVIPNAKHYPQKESPQLINTMIMDFLNKKYVNLERF